MKKTKTEREEEISQFKLRLKGQPKEEKILSIEQELANRGLSRMLPPGGLLKSQEELNYRPSDEDLQRLKAEIENNLEAYESETKRKELIPFMYDRDLNWYFNAKNIPAQRSIVMPTYEYFTEGPGKELFDPLDFFNLLEKQQDELKRQLSKPFEILNRLKSIPLSEKESHVLLGFILKWHGGYPVTNHDEQYYTVLSLIEKEFLKFPGETPEKKFCSTGQEMNKKLRDVAANIKAENPGLIVEAPNETEVTPQHDISGSHYIRKIRFDFEDLPPYVVQKGITEKFENLRFHTDREYHSWLEELKLFYSTIPTEYQLRALVKGIEYGKEVYSFHLENECNSPPTCLLNQSWQRRISLAEAYLEKIRPVETIQIQSIIEQEGKNKDFTTARQILALYFIFEQLQVRSHEIDRSVKAKFAAFLTGKNYKNIYDALENPFITKDKNFRFDDLQFVRKYFEDLGLSEIVKAINNQMEKPK